MHCAPCLQNLHYCRLKCLHAGYHIYIYFLNICAQDPKVYVPKNPHPNISPAPVHHTPIVRFSRFTGFLYSQVLLVQKSSCRHSIFRTLNLLTVAMSNERSKQGKSLADLLSVHLIRFTSERTVNFRYSTTVRLYYSCTATAVTAVQL